MKIFPVTASVSASETSYEKATLERVLDSAIEATRAQFGNIQIRIPQTNELRIVVQRGFQRPFLEFFEIVSHDATSACGAALAKGKRIVVQDVTSSPLYDDASRREMLRAMALACQSTPIIIRGAGIVGILSTHFDQPHRCSSKRLQHLDRLIREAAVLMAARAARSASAKVTRAREEYRDRSSKTRVIRGS